MHHGPVQDGPDQIITITVTLILTIMQDHEASQAEIAAARAEIEASRMEACA